MFGAVSRLFVLSALLLSLSGTNAFAEYQKVSRTQATLPLGKGSFTCRPMGVRDAARLWVHLKGIEFQDPLVHSYVQASLSSNGNASEDSTELLRNCAVIRDSIERHYDSQTTVTIPVEVTRRSGRLCETVRIGAGCGGDRCKECHWYNEESIRLELDGYVFEASGSDEEQVR